MAASSPEPFWDYSLALYGRPGVEACCLRLQDRLGVDVNLLLLCCWLAARGHDTIGEDAVGEILARHRTLARSSRPAPAHAAHEAKRAA